MGSSQINKQIGFCCLFDLFISYLFFRAAPVAPAIGGRVDTKTASGSASSASPNAVSAPPFELDAPAVLEALGHAQRLRDCERVPQCCECCDCQWRDCERSDTRLEFCDARTVCSDFSERSVSPPSVSRL